MNVSEMADYVWEVLDLDASDIGRRLIVRWANEGQRQVLNDRTRWSHLEAIHELSTVAGQHTYDIAAQIKTVSSIDTVASGPISIVDEAQAEALYWRSGSTPQPGKPQVVSLWGQGKLRLWPTPNDVYMLVIRGMRPAAAITEGGTPDLPEDLHDAVLEWIMQKAYLQQDDPDMAAIHRDLFARTLQVYGGREDDVEDASPLILSGGVVSRHRADPLGGPRIPSFGEFGGSVWNLIDAPTIEP